MVSRSRCPRARGRFVTLISESGSGDFGCAVLKGALGQPAFHVAAAVADLTRSKPQKWRASAVTSPAECGAVLDLQPLAQLRVRQELARRRDRWSLIGWDHARRLHYCDGAHATAHRPTARVETMRFVRRHETVRTQARFEKVRWQTRVAPTLRQEGASSNARSLQGDSSRLQLSVGSLSYLTRIYTTRRSGTRDAPIAGARTASRLRSPPYAIPFRNDKSMAARPDSGKGVPSP